MADSSAAEAGTPIHTHAHARTPTHTYAHTQTLRVLTQSRCWQLCSKWKQGSRPTTWTTLPIKWYVYNNTVLRLRRHTHIAHMHAQRQAAHIRAPSMLVHSQSKGNELMESQRTPHWVQKRTNLRCDREERELGGTGGRKRRAKNRSDRVWQTDWSEERSESLSLPCLDLYCQSDRKRQGMEK